MTGAAPRFSPRMNVAQQSFSLSSCGKTFPLVKSEIYAGNLEEPRESNHKMAGKLSSPPKTAPELIDMLA
jgi:hypothetical protein